MNTLLSSAEALALVNAEYAALGVAHHCRLLRRGFNDTYLVGIGADWHVLRVYLNHKYYIESPDAFAFELELLEHLFAEGRPVASATRRDAGELLGWTPTPLGERAFALFAYAPGDVLTRRTATPRRCFLAGEAIAGLHVAANGFRSERSRYRLDRRYLIDEPLRRIAEQRDEASRTIPERELEALEEMVASLGPVEALADTVAALDVSGDGFGVIHGDLHPGNIHFDGDRLTVFDFDHCAYGWRAYDLAVTEFMVEENRDALLEGYESVRPLGDGERACLPVFAKLRRLWDAGDSLAIDPVRDDPDG